MFLRISIAALAVLLAPASAHAAGVSVAAVPNKVELGQRGAAETPRVLITNGGNKPIDVTEVAAYPPAVGGIDASVAKAKSRLAPGESGEWKVTLQSDEPVVTARSVPIIVRYKRDGGGAGAISTEIGVSAYTPADVSKLATVALRASLETLTSGRSAPAYLIVSNLSASDLHVERVLSKVPGFLRVKVPRWKEVTVPPGGAKIVKVTLKAKDEVRPGKHQLVFQVPVRSDQGGEFALTAAQEATVGVEGESAILTATGVPAFFLVPGFLALATAMLLWKVRLRRRDTDGGEFFVEAKSAEFWVLAITASLLLLLAWPLLGIHLFDVYSRADVVRIWAISVAIGAALYLVVVEIRNRLREAREFTTGDAPQVALRRLAKNKQRLIRPRFPVTGQTGVMFMLQEERARPKSWMAAPIVLTYAVDPPPTELEESVNEALEAGDPEAFADLLANHEGQIQVDWSGDRTPLEVAAEKIGDRQAPDNLVQVS